MSKSLWKKVNNDFKKSITRLIQPMQKAARLISSVEGVEKVRKLCYNSH